MKGASLRVTHSALADWLGWLTFPSPLRASYASAGKIGVRVVAQVRTWYPLKM